MAKGVKRPLSSAVDDAPNKGAGKQQRPKQNLNHVPDKVQPAASQLQHTKQPHSHSKAQPPAITAAAADEAESDADEDSGDEGESGSEGSEGGDDEGEEGSSDGEEGREAGDGASPFTMGNEEEEEDEELESDDDGLSSEMIGDDDEFVEVEEESGAPAAAGDDDSDGDDIMGGGGSSSGSGDEGGEGGEKRETKALKEGGKFTEGEKGQSFAKAFSKILGKTPKALLAAEEGGAVAAEGAVAVLAGEKSFQKKQEEEKATSEASKAARKLRLLLKLRGHRTVPKRGEDPAHDLKEKSLGRLATKGVVLLFNAVAQAQKKQQDAASGANKAVKLSKASFLAQLKGASAGVSAAAAFGGTGAALSTAAAARKGAALAQADGERAPGWKVLQEGFTGLSGSNKMKDWDKAQEVDSDMEGGELDVKESESEDGGDGW
ncbi:MAG: hypothetical protein WDW38_002693 [Sanguina aurantia]